MNKFYTTVIVILLFTSINASALTDREMEVCSLTAEQAEIIMEQRQNGVAMANLMEVVNDADSQQMVIEVYEGPRFTSPEYNSKSR